MCGRAAQTSEAVSMAAESLLLHITNIHSNKNNNNNNNNNNNEQDNNNVISTTNLKKCIEQMKKVTSSSSSSTGNTSTTTIDGTMDDTTTPSKATSSPPSSYNNGSTATIDSIDSLSIYNYNMSPGMEAIIFWYDTNTKEITMGKKVWGLIPRNGTSSNPIPNGMNKHFEGLMFNARSDTLYEKQTFAKLVKSPGKTCIIALNGYFEWKSEVKGRKQPYYVYHNSNDNNKSDNISNKQVDLSSYLLIAGLWTSVSTGDEDNPTLDTFCMITTEVCTSLKWLHSRMPVVVHDVSLAYQWLLYPSENMHEMLYQSSSQYMPNDYLNWYGVTPNMTSMKFRTIDSIQPLPKMKTVKSFFTPATPNTTKTTTSSSSSISLQNKLSPKTKLNSTKTNSMNHNDNEVSSPLLSRKRHVADNSITTNTIHQSPSTLSTPMKKKTTIIDLTSSPSSTTKTSSTSSVPSNKKSKTTATLLSFFQPKQK